MENYAIVIFILAVMIGLSSIADHIKIPYPVLLIIAGIAVGFIPALPPIDINPEIIFLIFLPPLLYDAAFNISFKEFKTNINTISTLAITLVFITAIGIAVVAHYMIPGMSWPISFVLGAILSATDAVAAMSITKGLGLSHKNKYDFRERKPGKRCIGIGGLSFCGCCCNRNRFCILESIVRICHFNGGWFSNRHVHVENLSFYP